MEKVVRAQGKGIYFQPIEEDPLKALSKLGSEKLKGKSIEQLKKEARTEIEENDQIISSDNVYEKFGFDVIDLKKK